MSNAIAEPELKKATEVTQRTEPVNGCLSVPAGITVRVRINQSWMKDKGPNADKPIIMVLDDGCGSPKTCYVQEVIFCGPSSTVAVISETDYEYDAVECARIYKRHACIESKLGARYR